MKKIKALHYLVITLLSINTIWFLRYIYYQPTIYKAVYGEERSLGFFPFKDIGFLLNMFFYALFLIGLFYVQRGLYGLSKKGFFNNKSYSWFRIAGSLFVISGLLNFIKNVGIPLFKGTNFFNLFIGNDFLILIIGVSLYLIADIIQDGNLLKQENDLTI